MSTEASPPASPEPESFLEALLGKELLAAKALARFRAWPLELRTTLTATLFASLVLVPYLGAVGLWDCWEPHYGEVAREMIQRNDYVHPFWENAWFFSKPAFTMWMQALGMQGASLGVPFAVVLALGLLGGGVFLWQRGGRGERPVHEFFGTLLAVAGGFFGLLAVMALTHKLNWKFADVASGDGALPLYLEWGFRLPFAGFSILAVALLTYALTRVASARTALGTAFVLVTMPLYFLLSRQAVTDTPIVASTIAGIACALVGLLDAESKKKSEWWYASYVFFAIATLAKGWLGFGIPMVVYMAYAAIGRLDFTRPKELSAHFSWMWTHARQALGTGIAAGVVVGVIAARIGASLGTMFMSGPPGADGKDLITAPGWLGIMWGCLTFWAVATVLLGRVKLTERPPTIIAMAYEMRLGTGILLFLAVCLPWYYEMFTFWRLDDESKLYWFRFVVHDQLARLTSGVHATSSGGFTYFIEQGAYGAFPWVVLVPGAFATVARMKVRGASSTDGLALIAVLWFVITWGLIGASATKFHHYVFPMLPPMAILMGLFIDRLWRDGIDDNVMPLLLGIPLFVLVGKDLASTPKDFTDLFVYNYDRPYPAFLTERPALGQYNLKQLMGMGMILFGVAAALFALARNKVSLYTTALAGGLVWALWFNWSHWVDLSHHWTQRDQFWRYYTQRRPGEPIAAFLMNWRGETFYSRNTVKQIKDNANVGMAQYAQLPGRKWALVEHNRLGILKGAVGADKTVTLIDKDLNNKFVLVTIE